MNAPPIPMPVPIPYFKQGDAGEDCFGRFSCVRSGVNGQGNKYVKLYYGHGVVESNTYHYYNDDGSYFFNNPDGSKYYRLRNFERYTPPPAPVVALDDVLANAIPFEVKVEERETTVDMMVDDVIEELRARL